MSLEDKITELTKVMTKVADLLAGGATIAGGGATKGKDKDKAADKKAAVSKYTADQVKEIILRVKDEVDADTAKAIIAKFAGAGKKLPDLANMPEKFDAAYAAAEEALAATGGEDGEGDDI